MIGVIFTVFSETEENINRCLNPWIQDDIKIVATSCQFLKYNKEDNSNTVDILTKLVGQSKILDFISKDVEREHEARDMALQRLKKENVDSFVLLDSDEFYIKEEIDNIKSFVQRDSFITWFSINFKNLVFDGDHYIDGFCPPRIFRAKSSNGFRIKRVYWDNDICYEDTNGNEIDYKQLSHKVIPKSLAFPLHETWLNNERSRKKVNYQNSHFGHCGYKWNEQENKLEFNEEYYKKIGEQYPILIKL